MRKTPKVKRKQAKSTATSKLDCGHRCATKALCKHRCCNAAARATISFRQVYETAELLKYVLLQLGGDLRDLLRAQQVCRDWMAVIDTSPRIQLKLFLAPDQSDAGTAHNESGTTATATSLLQRSRDPEAGSQSQTRVIACYNRLLLKPPPPPTYLMEFPSRKEGILYFVHKGNNSISNLPRDATQRKMLLTQPPIASVRVMWNYFRRQGYSVIYNLRESSMVLNEHGVTFGDLGDDYAKVVGTDVEAMMQGCKLEFAGTTFSASESCERTEMAGN
ncbi:hypothetical protein LTR85_011099 [Meristemomyces frigidus]|nr:hypothetical protein LTR85_011099 [Meristemomyces frigidus]